MPDTYQASAPKDAKPFDYQGKQYQPGDTFQSTNACDMLGFAKAYQGANPEGGRINRTKGFWQTMDALCPAGDGGSPVDGSSTSPDEGQPDPTQGDSAEGQGAPKPKSEGAGGGGQTDGDGGQTPGPGEEAERPDAGVPNAPPISNEKPQAQTNAGDPVDIFSGAFYLEEEDLKVPNTLLPLSFERVYRSGTPVFGPLGWNWDHNWNLYLRILNGGQAAVWRRLHEDLFATDGHSFEPPPGIFETLEPVQGLPQAYEITKEGGTVLRFERPVGWTDGERIPLLWIRDRHGNTLRLTYGAEDKLEEVRDDDDRFLHFAYDTCGLLVEVSDHAGRACTYEHDEFSRHLVCATLPATADHPAGTSRIYQYGDPYADPDLRHSILRVEDDHGNVYLENVYDEDPASFSYGRVLEQLYGAYLYQFRYTQLQYVPQNALYMNLPAVQVEVMNPDFGLETYTFNYRGDLLDRRYRLVKDKSFRVVAIQYAYDTQGNLISTTLPDGSQELLTYDHTHSDPRMRGKLLKRERTSASGFPAPSRIVWQGGYEPLFQLLVEERNEVHARTRYKYDLDVTPGDPSNSGKLAQILHPDATLPDGTIQSSITKLEHNAKGQVTAVVLPNGVRNEMTYGVAGPSASRLVSEVFDAGGLGILLRTGYNAFGFDATHINGNGHTTSRVVNALGLIERESSPLINGVPSEHVFHYNSDRKLVSVERPAGDFTGPLAGGGSSIVDQFDRDVLGFLKSSSLAANTSEARSLRFVYDHRGFPLKTVHPDRSEILRTVDERGLLLKEVLLGVDGASLTRRMAYDRAGNLKQSSDPSGAITHFEYDGFGRVNKRVAPNGTEFRYTWLPGDLLSSVEAIGDDGTGVRRRLSLIHYTYDEKSRRITETVESFAEQPGLSVPITTTFFHDTLDRIVRTVDHRGGVGHLVYDGLGRLASSRDPMGNEERYHYDQHTNVIRQDSLHQEPDGSVSTLTRQFQFDPREQLSATSFPDGSIRSYVYDARGLRVQEVDCFGRIKQVDYNAFGNPVAETLDAGGLAIHHAWTLDAMSRQTAYTDPAGQTTTFSLDSLGRWVSRHLPAGSSLTRTYDASGHVASEVSSGGTRLDYTYDPTGRLIRISNPSVAPTVAPVADHTFAYDGLNRLVSAQIGSNQVRRAYDSRGRLLKEETHGQVVACAYDDVLGQMSRSWPDGRTERLQHNFDGTITTIEEAAHGLLGSGLTQIAAFVPSGAAFLGRATFAGGLVLQAEYDARKRVVEMRATSGAGLADSVRYRYDQGNFRRIEAFTGHSPSLRYLAFDQKYRLTSAASGFPFALPNGSAQSDQDTAIASALAAAADATHTEGFAYNASDERLTNTETGSPTRTYTYQSGHRLATDGIDTFTHSTDGLLQSGGVYSYDADALGRIVSIRMGANTLCALEYDALNRPSILHEGPNPPRRLNYFGDAVVQEMVGNTPVRQMTMNAQGLPIAIHEAGATRYTLFDGRFNLVALVDDQGHLLESYRYKAFGLPSVFDAAGNPLPTSAFGVAPTFGGQRYLPSVGLYLSRRRLMNPVHGLFLSPDPLGYGNSPSLYVYAQQNPIDLIDPEGEFAFLAVLAVMAIGAVIAGSIDAAHQGIEMAEDPDKAREGFSWSELGLSMGFGAVAAPVLVLAPELAVPLAGYGVYGGAKQIQKGNYVTGTFDIAVSLLPFASKSVRGTTFGEGTYYGQMRGMGQAAPFATRSARFTLIDSNLKNLWIYPGGKRIGLGYSGDTQGHAAVILEGENGKFWFVEKNARRALGSRDLLAAFNEADTPPDFYFNDPTRPFKYESMRVSKSAVQDAINLAKSRLAADQVNPEPFDFKCQNCSHFANDVLQAGGFKGMGNGRASGLWSDFINFGRGKDMTNSAPFWAQPGLMPKSK